MYDTQTQRIHSTYHSLPIRNITQGTQINSSMVGGFKSGLLDTEYLQYNHLSVAVKMSIKNE